MFHQYCKPSQFLNYLLGAFWPGLRAGLHFDDGVRALETEKLDEAEFHFSTVIALRADRWKAHFNLALIAIRRRQLDEALSFLTSAARLNPRYAPALSQQIEILLELERYDEALRLCDNLEALNANDFWPHVYRSSIYQARGQMTESKLALEAAITRQPESSVPRIRYASLLLDSGDTEQAEPAVHILVARHPNDASVLNLLGCIHRTKGELPQAIECFERALVFDGENANTLQNLANCYLALGSYNLAKSEFEKLIQLCPRNWAAYLNLGVIYGRMGNEYLSQAISHTENAIRLRPDCAKAYYNLATFESYRRSAKKAISALREAIRIDPKYRTLAKEDLDFTWLRNRREFAKLTANCSGASAQNAEHKRNLEPFN